MTANDFDVRAFARMFEDLPEHLPISDAMSNGYEDSWYTSQREHMCGWFRAQTTTGSGSYTRKEPNYSARTTYQRLASAPAMIWIAEALGVDADVIERAAAEVEEEPEPRSHCGIIRQHIPWEVIADKAAEMMDEMGLDPERAGRPTLLESAEKLVRVTVEWWNRKTS